MTTEVMIKELPSIVESKLTKGEMIDVLLSDLRQQLLADRRVAEEHQEAFPDLTLDEVLPFLKHAKLETSHCHYDDEFYVRFTLRDSKAPAAWKAWLKERDRREARVQTARDRLNQFDNRRADAKSMALRDVLEGTPEGRVLLRQLEALKVKALKRLEAKP